MFSFSPFNVIHKDLGNGNDLYIVDIDDIDAGLKQCIDDTFVKICEGNSGTDLSLVKQRVVNFLTTKKGSDLEMGAIAEFFLHLFLNASGFNPQFLYLNLEEGSIKKGFDGYYELNNIEWILESKSGSITTAGITHASKIKEAYKDLQEKFGGDVKNNPWQNAYNHANLIDVGADRNIRANIKKFSDDFLKGVFYDIAQFNIIPGSTIVLDGVWASPDVTALEEEIQTAVAKFHFKQIKVLCVTKTSLQLFWDYLTTP